MDYFFIFVPSWSRNKLYIKPDSLKIFRDLRHISYIKTGWVPRQEQKILRQEVVQNHRIELALMFSNEKGKIKLMKDLVNPNSTGWGSISPNLIAWNVSKCCKDVLLPHPPSMGTKIVNFRRLNPAACKEILTQNHPVGVGLRQVVRYKLNLEPHLETHGF